MRKISLAPANGRASLKARTLTLLLSGRGVLVPETDADLDLARELVHPPPGTPRGAAPAVRPSTLPELVQAAADHKVRLVFRTDLAPIE